MQNRFDPERLQADLKLPWLVVAVMTITLVALLALCLTQGEQLQQPLPEAQRVIIRTVLYIVAIITFPITNLLRHIQLRLNQTMPLEHKQAETAAKSRYLTTVTVSMSLIQTPGIYGFVMFILGDPTNTLYILTLMSALGLFLYRPKLHEYEHVMDALVNQEHE